MRFPIGIPELAMIAIMIGMVLVVIWPMAMICRRLGFSPWLGILAGVPLANVALLWFLALSQWPKVDTSPRSV